MAIIERILCPIDYSDCSTQAIGHAGALAGWFQAELTALHVIEVPRSQQDAEQVTAAGRELRERLLERARASIPAGARKDVRVVALLREGAGAHEILRCAGESTPDLIVMGTHGRAGLERFVVGSVAEAVVRKSACPVLTVWRGGPSARAAGGAPFRTILCPVDFSHTSKQALSFCFDLAQRSDARIIQLNVVEILPEWESRELAHFRVPEFARALEEDAFKQLRALVPARNEGWKPEQMVARGRAWREILRVASEQNADMIVMGTGGHGPLDALFLGSTTSHVMRAAPCPVMTIRAR